MVASHPNCRATLHAKRVDLYLHQQGLDTSTPAGRAMFQMLGLIAEFERSMIRGRVVSGMALRARAARTTSTKSGRAIGRQGVAEATKDAIRRLLGAGQSECAIVQQLGGVGDPRRY
jgi:DNA invertase Pin-like site-specific DNA recombinase